jgi:hypothetical protein
VPAVLHIKGFRVRPLQSHCPEPERADTYVSADVDSDHKVDLEILLTGVRRLTAGDFISMTGTEIAAGRTVDNGASGMAPFQRVRLCIYSGP